MSDVAVPHQVPHVGMPSTAARTWYYIKKALRSPEPYLAIIGIGLWLGLWWLFCEGLQLPRFVKDSRTGDGVYRVAFTAPEAGHVDLDA